ncbi:sigma-E processing peptidase SpoIIGA [Paenibacillus thalictri]|uniref:Sporulation sigma-E factor-processing peptidase n=1 Tax=Paenibacillus thalictri TaxID=2527873 RepID=A0A4Q9DSU8_9BACL|nr:sigma-E processing peptidase SpoIIGA [Paenibacillus thalictri]TBL78164.1 sigma-E processing peptidase SpoIIGA [Paenibacillus thalictri]
MIVYLDLIFLTNFVIDGALLYTTAKVRKIRFAWWRLIVSAFVGACYVVFMFIPDTSFLFTFFVKFGFALIMLAVAFGFVSLQYFLRNLGMFYLINFAVAGAIFGVHYFLESSSEVLGGIALSQSGGLSHEVTIGFTFVAVLLMPAIFFFRSMLQSARQREEVSSFIAHVHIFIDQAEACCSGLIDTGNQLYDPLTRTPVMIMEASEWDPYIPESWLKRIREAEVDQIISAIGTEDGEPFIWQDRLRLVPYRGINKSTQFMLAIKPDRVVITHNDKTFDSPKVLIGLDGGRLSSDNSYQAIIHPMLIQS